MVDANKIVREILDAIGGVRVTFQRPKQFNLLPVISYYELAAKPGMCFDNAEQAQTTNMQIDIWGKSGAECSRIAIKVYRAMNEQGWFRAFARDMPPEDGVYHKTMRFYKELFFEDERND